MADKIQLPVDAKVLYRMYEYAAYAKHHFGTEVAGWGHYHAKKGIYKLAPLTKQEVSGMEVDAFPNDILNDVDYDIRDMIVQWHSHVDMGVTPSGTDISNIKDSLKLMPILISIIVNCKYQYSARLDTKRIGGAIYTDLDSHITLDVELVPYYSNAEVSREVKSKLSKPKPKPIPVIEMGFRAYNDYDGAVQETAFVKGKLRYLYYADGVYGYWDIHERKHIPYDPKKIAETKNEKKEETKIISQPSLYDEYIEWTGTDLQMAITKAMEIATANPEDFVYDPLNMDSLTHKNGASIFITDFGIMFKGKIGGMEIFNQFLEECNDKKDSNKN